MNNRYGNPKNTFIEKSHPDLEEREMSHLTYENNSEPELNHPDDVRAEAQRQYRFDLKQRRIQDILDNLKK